MSLVARDLSQRGLAKVREDDSPAARQHSGERMPGPVRPRHLPPSQLGDGVAHCDIGVGCRQATHRPVALNDVEDASVRNRRHCQIGNALERRGVVQGLGQRGTGHGPQAGSEHVGAASQSATSLPCSHGGVVMAALGTSLSMESRRDHGDTVLRRPIRRMFGPF